MKVIITGALGHIGSQLIRELPDLLPKSDFVLIDNLITQRYASLFNLPAHTNYKFIEGDILKLDIDKIIESANVVIHLAAITDAASSFDKQELVENNNLNSTELIAKSCSTHKVPLIFPSSTSVYGTQESQIDENCAQHELAPQSPYAEVKLKEEKLLQNLQQENGLKVTICRFGTIFGTSPGMRFHTAVNKFCWQAVLGQKLTIWETAYEQKRPYLDLRDAIRAIAFFIHNQIFDGNIYNVVTSNHTVHEVIDIIKQFIPDLSINFVTHKIMNQLSYEVLNTNINKKNFSFNGNLYNGIQETIATLRNMNR